MSGEGIRREEMTLDFGSIWTLLKYLLLLQISFRLIFKCGGTLTRLLRVWMLYPLLGWQIDYQRYGRKWAGEMVEIRQESLH